MDKLQREIQTYELFEGGDSQRDASRPQSKGQNVVMQKRRSRLAESNSRSPKNFNGKGKAVRASSKRVTKQGPFEQQQNDQKIFIEDMGAGHYGAMLAQDNNNGAMSTKSNMNEEVDDHYQNDNPQIRNQKSRKLYTSVGAYNSTQGPSSSQFSDQVPFLNFNSSGPTNDHQRDFVVSQQHILNGVHQNQVFTQNQSVKRGGQSSNKDRVKQGSKKHVNSQAIAHQIPGNDSISIMSGGQSLGHNQGVIDQAQAYQSMINNGSMISQNTQDMISNQNVNDISVLSVASQQLSFVQRQTNASQLHPGGIGGNNINNSVMLDNQQVRKSKKVTSNSGKITSEPKINVVGGNMNRGLIQNGVLSSNMTQIGNFVGSGQNNFEGSYIDGMQRTKSGTKKVTSKMISTNGPQRSSQHQQFQQNQIHFLSNFSADESVNNGPEGVDNFQHIGNFTGPQIVPVAPTQQNSSANTSVLIQNQKQRPHSSFKAQTQKSINTYKQQLVNVQNGNQKQVITGNNSRAQQLLIGVNGVIGISNNESQSAQGQPGQIGNFGTKQAGSRKNKHINQVGSGKNKFNGLTQQINSMSVYQNDLVVEQHQRESRRMGRGSGGVGGVEMVSANELNQITKEQREMRTSSATGPNTNTEFGLLNINGKQGSQMNGNLNFGNQNQSYLINGGGSAALAISGTQNVSTGGVFTQIQNPTASQGSAMFSMTTVGPQGSQRQKPGSVKSSKGNKVSKRNLAHGPGANNMFNYTNGSNNMLSGTSMNNTDQIAIIHNVDSMRSGDGVRMSVGPNGKMLNQGVSGGGYGISMFPANKYDQQQQQRSKQASGQIILPYNDQPLNMRGGSNNVNQHTQQQSQKSHQQSMQKFLQQQMPQYNTAGQNTSKSKQKKSISKQSNPIYLGNQSNGAIQEYHQAANFYNNNKQSQHKLTKKQIEQQHLLASDRIRGIARDPSSRKNGTQTAIGVSGKSTVLNSSQIQIANPQGMKASSLTRARVANHPQNSKQFKGGKNMTTNSLSGSKGTVQALQQIQMHGAVNQIGQMSGTPGIQANQKITLMNTGPQVTNQRNAYSYAQNTNDSQLNNPAYIASSRRNKGRGNTTMSVGGPTSQNSSKNGTSYVNRAKQRGNGANTNHSTGMGPQGTHLDQLGFETTDTLLQLGGSQHMEMHASFDSPQTNVQIQIAEQAIREMKASLYRNRASTGQNSQARPKSQNDAQSYAIHGQEVDAMSLESKEKAPLSGQSRTFNGINRCETSSPQVQNQGQDHDYNQMNETVHGQVRAEGVDKMHFLEIIKNSFEKVSACVHPRVGSSLNQIRQLYDTYIDQVDNSHQQDLQRNSIEIQQMQSCITDLEVENQNYEMQIGQNQMRDDRKSEQLNDFVSHNDNLDQQLKNYMKQNQSLSLQLKNLQERYDKQQKVLNHLKNNIEDQRYNNGRENNANGAVGSENLFQPQSNNLNDDPLNLNGSIDPPGTETQKKFDQQHVRINNGEIRAHSRRGFGESNDGSISSIPSYERFNDLGNSQSQQQNRVPNLQEVANQMTEEEMRTLAEDGQMIFDPDGVDIDLKELEIGDSDRRMVHSRSREREFNHNHEDDHEQSYFSSKIDSSSDITVDSDILFAYEHARKTNPNLPPPPGLVNYLPQEKSTNRHTSQQQDKSPIKVPTLNFNAMGYEEDGQQDDNQQNLPSNEAQMQKDQVTQQPKMAIKMQKTKIPPIGGLGASQGNGPPKVGMLDISKLQKGGYQDYQDEFMAAAEGFSESWRELLKKDKRF